MEQIKIKSLLLAGVITLTASMFAGCTEYVEDSAEMTTNQIVISVDEVNFGDNGVSTRGSKTASISSFGVSASVYDAASTYSSVGCGSYFFNASATAGTPTSYYWPTSSYKVSFFAHYPYNNAAFTVQSAANALGAPTYHYTVPSTIANQVDVMTGQNVNILGGGSSAVNMTMKHRCSAICFSVTNSRSSAITLNSISIEGVKYSGTLNEEAWTLTSAVNSSFSNPFTLTYGSSIAASATANVTGTTNIFLMLPQTIPAGAKVKVVIDGEDPLYADLTGSWIASKQYNYSLDIQNSTIIVVDEDTEIEDWKTSIDLSKVDNAGNPRSSMTTANCYLVHAAGKYRLPLVYGNAIKNGVANTVAYNPGGTTSSTYIKQFVNHAGIAISGPWITKSGSGVNAGMGLTAATAELLWQDRSGLITNVSVNGDYLEFTVGTFGGGNALIAVKDGSGTILWSWHIWATEETLASTTAVNTGSHTYNVASVNLGWVPTGGSGKQGYCPYYQWGRKDPFIPCNGTTNGNTNKTIYNISGTDITPASITASSTGIQYESSTAATIADNIKNPIKHYHNSSSYGPCSTTYYNMWDAQTTATGNVTSATVKTIYDPCPPGFCVPTSNLAYYMSNGSNRSDSNWDGTNLGKTWTLNGASIYFPAAGYREHSSGRLQFVGSDCDYWSSTYGNGLVPLSDGWHFTDGTERSRGFSIRPVAEE